MLCVVCFVPRSQRRQVIRVHVKRWHVEKHILAMAFACRIGQIMLGYVFQLFYYYANKMIRAARFT